MDSYVTIRKRRQLTRSLSLSPFEDMNDTLNSTQSGVCCTKSLDLSTHIPSNIHDELKGEIEQLKINLLSTQNELENTILENNELKRDIARLNQEVQFLKKFCQSPLTPTKKKDLASIKKTTRRRLTDSFKKTPTGTPQQEKTSSCTQVTTSTQITPNIGENEDHITQQPSLETSHYNNNSQQITKASTEQVLPQPTTEQQQPVKKMDNKQTRLHLTHARLQNTRKRLFIFGGQQCSQLSEYLIKSRLYNPYERYQVTSFIKPHASTENILECIKLYDITADDRLILCVGENDSNPNKIMIELGSALKMFNVCPVLILKVCYNKYLNTCKLNNMLRQISNHFSHCKFVDYYVDTLYTTHFNNLLKLCNTINSVLDQIDYDLKFLPFNKNTLRIIHTGPRKLYSNRSTQTDSVNLSHDENVNKQFFRNTKCRWNMF